MSSTIGENLTITIFGQSHSAAIGAVIQGVPAGKSFSVEELREFMRRRAPGNSPTATARKEADEPEFLSGVIPAGEGRLAACGAPIAVTIRNTDARSGDYSELRDVPRPSHADFAAFAKYGEFHDIAGGGHFSGRLTAPLCAAGGICVQLLRESGVAVTSRVVRVGGETDPALFEREILAAKADGDSVGGIIECEITGLPAGLGEPIFGGIENRIAAAVFGIPGIKGIEFGNGFACAELRGSENNDRFVADGGAIKTATNNSGGILGGLSSGMPVVFRVAVKPTPSIGREQQSVSLSRREPAVLRVKGRHDPCIVPRAVACVEAAAAVVAYDLLLSAGG